MKITGSIIKKLGAYLVQTGLKGLRRLNSQINNAVYKNNSINGVTTAVENYPYEFHLEFPSKKMIRIYLKWNSMKIK